MCPCLVFGCHYARNGVKKTRKQHERREKFDESIDRRELEDYL